MLVLGQEIIYSSTVIMTPFSSQLTARPEAAALLLSVQGQCSAALWLPVLKAELLLLQTTASAVDDVEGLSRK